MYISGYPVDTILFLLPYTSPLSLPSENSDFKMILSSRVLGFFIVQE